MFVQQFLALRLSKYCPQQRVDEKPRTCGAVEAQSGQAADTPAGQQLGEQNKDCQPAADSRQHQNQLAHIFLLKLLFASCVQMPSLIRAGCQHTKP